MKRVKFSDTVIIYPTYSKDEYSREMIDHLLYRRGYKRVTDAEMNSVFVALDIYKLYQMPVHIDSIQNNHYHKRNIKF